MCKKQTSCCQKPEKLEGDSPKDCSPERVKECHGDEKSHPCAPKESSCCCKPKSTE